MYKTVTSFINRLVNPDSNKEGNLSAGNITQSLGIEIGRQPFVIQAK